MFILYYLLFIIYCLLFIDWITIKAILLSGTKRNKAESWRDGRDHALVPPDEFVKQLLIEGFGVQGFWRSGVLEIRADEFVK